MNKREREKEKDKVAEHTEERGKGEAIRPVNESHDSYVFRFAYSVHRLIRHALLTRIARYPVAEYETLDDALSASRHRRLR